VTDIDANPVPLTYEQATSRMREMARQIRDAEAQHRHQIKIASEAVARHRKAQHDAYLVFRIQEKKAAGESEFLAKTAAGGEEADAYAQRELVRAYQDRLEDLRGERASLHRLVEWSQKFNPTGDQDPHRP
jgi:hypothetical protein